MSQTQAYNPTDKPIGPVTYDGKPFIFQPDQKLSPGRWALEYDAKAGKHFLKQVDTKPLRSNVITIPLDFAQNYLKTNANVRDFGTDKLIVDQDVVNELELQRSQLDEEVKALKEERAEIMVRARAEWEAEKAALLKTIADQEAEKKLAKGPVLK